jgi:hypothetical protein
MMPAFEGVNKRNWVTYSPREFVRPREEIGLVSGKERSWLAPTVTRRFETSSVLKSGVKKGGVLREAKTVPSLV